MKECISILLLCGILLLNCCNRDNEEEGLGLPKLLWKTSTSDNLLIKDQVAADVQFDGGVLFDGMEEGKPCLYFLNASDGKIRWKWNDFFAPDEAWATVRHPYQNNSLLLVQIGTKRYCINLSTGLSEWKKKNIGDFGTFASGIGDIYYIPAKFFPNADGTYEGKILRGSLKNSSDEIVVTPNYARTYVDQNSSKGIVWSCFPTQSNSENFLLSIFDEPLPNYEANSYFGLYNLDLNIWEYDKIPFVLNTRYTVGIPIVNNGKIYNSGVNFLRSYELATGKFLWNSNLSNNISSTDGWADGKILSTTQDRITHCIDPATGKELWALTTSGNPSIIKELNGVAYFVGGNAKLFAIDVAAGKILWQFDSPDIKTNSNAFFKQAVRVRAGENGGKGKVMVQSYLNAFCYEAAR